MSFRHRGSDPIQPSYTPRVTLKDLIREGFLQPGEGTIAIKAKGTENEPDPTIPHQTLTKRGSILVRTPEGTQREFDTPSAFANFFIQKRCNGWYNTLYRAPSSTDKWEKLSIIRDRMDPMCESAPCRLAVAATTPKNDPNSNPNTKLGFLYMLHTRACINGKEPIYKVGMTERTINERLKNYTKGTLQIAGIPVPKCLTKKAEAFALKRLNCSFERASTYGREYFKGDRFEIWECLTKAVQDFLKLEKVVVSPAVVKRKVTHWTGFCGKTFQTRSQAFRYLKKEVFPALNQSFTVNLDGSITEVYPGGKKITRTISSTLMLHQNRWLTWESAPHILPRNRRVEVLREWMAWPERSTGPWTQEEP